MQQPQQPKQGLIGSAFQKLEQAARSAAPGLTQQVDRLMASVGINSSSTTTQLAPCYQQPSTMPPYPGAVPQQGWPYAQPGAGYPALPQQHPQQHPQQYPQHCPQQYPQQYPQQHPQQYPQQGHQGWQAPPPYPYQPMPRPPVTQVYVPSAGAYPPAAPSYQHVHPAAQQPWPQQWQGQPVQQFGLQRQQQHRARPEIPIIEATVNIKPSGLPVGTAALTDQRSAATAASAASAASGAPGSVAAPSAQLQPLDQVLQQLWASAVPAASFGAAAADLAGRWYHQDAGFLSEAIFMADGRFLWHRSNTSSNGADRAAVTGAGGDAAAAAAGCSSQAADQQRGETWHGIWRWQEGNASAGRLHTVFIIQQHQQVLGAWPQQQRVISYQRSALDDTLMLDNLAHVRMGPA